MPHDRPDRIVELEIQLAHLQRLYEQLNEVVIQQGRQSDHANRRINELQDQLKELKSKREPDTDPLDEKPPHY